MLIIETNMSTIWHQSAEYKNKCELNLAKSINNRNKCEHNLAKSADHLSKSEHNLAKNQLNIKTNESPIWQKCIRMRLFWLVFNHCGDDHECMRIEYE